MTRNRILRTPALAAQKIRAFPRAWTHRSLCTAWSNSRCSFGPAANPIRSTTCVTATFFGLRATEWLIVRV